MPTLHITEYARSGRAGHGDLHYTMQEPAVAEQTLGISGTSSQSNEFNSATGFVRLYSDTDCFIRFGDDPTATTNSQPLPATMEIIRPVSEGIKLAVIS